MHTVRDGVESVALAHNRLQELWLTELGTLLLSAARAPAGVKRPSRLVRAAAWMADDLKRWLVEQIDRAFRRLAPPVSVVEDRKTQLA